VLTHIQRWGNSQGLRLSKDVLADAALGVGDAVDVSVEDGRVILTPARRVRGSHDLRELVARMPSGRAPEVVDWGPATGREVW
jgi:antitoxin MazE